MIVYCLDVSLESSGFIKDLPTKLRCCHDCRAMTKAIRQLCADVQTPVKILKNTDALVICKPTVGSLPPEVNLEDFAVERKIQRLERAMQSVETSNCLVCGQLVWNTTLVVWF